MRSWYAWYEHMCLEGLTRENNKFIYLKSATCCIACWGPLSFDQVLGALNGQEPSQAIWFIKIPSICSLLFTEFELLKWITKPLWAGSSNRLGSVALYGLQPLCKGTFVGKRKWSNEIATKSGTCITAPGVAVLASFSCPLACAVCIAETFKALHRVIDYHPTCIYMHTLLLKRFL